MKSFLVGLFSLLILCSCDSQFKRCESVSPDEKLNIYNNILNELIEEHFYVRYLGEDAEKIYAEDEGEKTDTAKIRKMLTNFQNKLYNDSARFCTIYLDTAFSPYFEPWTYFKESKGYFASELREILLPFAGNEQAIIDSMNNMQVEYKASDFQLCTSKILPIENLANEEPKCFIGVVSFSRLFLDKSNGTGLVYINFRCGGLCGFGRLLVIERKNDRWRIKEILGTWIS